MPRIHRQTRTIEKYLEVIFLLERNNGEVRVKDIATRLGLQKGTVSGALKKLKAHKWIIYPPYRSIRLTARGRRVAESVVRRNSILKQFLVEILKMDPQDAKMAAGRMGYSVEDNVIGRMESFVADSNTQFADHCHS